MPTQRRRKPKRAPHAAAPGVLYLNAFGQPVTIKRWREECTTTPSLQMLEQALFSIVSALPYPSAPNSLKRTSDVFKSPAMATALQALRELPSEFRPGLLNRTHIMHFALRFTRAIIKAA